MFKRAAGAVALSALAIAMVAGPVAAATTQIVDNPGGLPYTHVIKAAPNGVINQWWVTDAGTLAAHDVLKPVDSFQPFGPGEYDLTYTWDVDGFWTQWFPEDSGYYVARTYLDPQEVLDMIAAQTK